METKGIHGGGGTISGSGTSQDDLKSTKAIHFNAPPRDERCECCGRHIRDLKPFGGPDDPYNEFTGGYLIKKYRPTGPFDQAAMDLFLKWFEKCDSPQGYRVKEAELARKYGEREVRRVMITALASKQVGASWECRDCCILDSDEYFAKLREQGITCDPEDFIVFREPNCDP